MPREIRCPSGLSGVVRGLRANDVDYLTSQAGSGQNTNLSKAIDKILTGCWIETTDQGVYEFNGVGPDWRKVIIGDRLCALLEIRKATYPEEGYSFTVQCGNSFCGTNYEWELDLDDLPVKMLNYDDKDNFKNGNRFETILGDGKKVWFRLMTGADEERIAKMGAKIRNQGALLTALENRILEIEGVSHSDTRKYLEEMEMADVRALLAEFDKADGGIETTIDVQCPSCGRMQEIELPFDRNFLLPKMRD